MLYIGVDLGTSAVKLLMMDENGNIQKIVSKRMSIIFSIPGLVRTESTGLVCAVNGRNKKELTSECDKSQVAGISFGGQMHGLVVLDKEDQVIRPAILWNDGRTTKETNYLNQVIGKDKLSEYTANIAFAGFTAPKILWMKENEPENYKKNRKDYAAKRLSGLPAFRFVLYRYVRCFGNAAHGCGKQMLVKKKCLIFVDLSRNSFRSSMKAMR